MGQGRLAQCVHRAGIAPAASYYACQAGQPEPSTSGPTGLGPCRRCATAVPTASHAEWSDTGVLSDRKERNERRSELARSEADPVKPKGFASESGLDSGRRNDRSDAQTSGPRDGAGRGYSSHAESSVCTRCARCTGARHGKESTRQKGAEQPHGPASLEDEYQLQTGAVRVSGESWRASGHLRRSARCARSKRPRPRARASRIEAARRGSGSNSWRMLRASDSGQTSCSPDRRPP